MWPPGTIDIGTCCTISCDVWVDAISVTYTGKPTTITPSTRIRCERNVRAGRRSTITTAASAKLLTISPPLQGEGEGVGMGDSELSAPTPTLPRERGRETSSLPCEAGEG